MTLNELIRYCLSNGVDPDAPLVLDTGESIELCQEYCGDEFCIIKLALFPAKRAAEEKNDAND